MARPYRLQAENFLYHITSRGNDKKRIFPKDLDCRKFLDYVLAAKKKYEFYLLAYVLMPNHYHLLIETIHPNISKIMQFINTSYTIYHNIKYKKIGHLFQGRFKSIIVDKAAYFIELTRYIHLNPVRAGIVNRPELFHWSSYKGYLQKKSDGYLDKNEVDRYLNMNKEKYKLFVLDNLLEKEKMFKDIYAGFILGKPQFIKDTLDELKIQVEGDEVSYKDKLQLSRSIDDIVEEVAMRYKKTKEELYKGNSRSFIDRKIAVYLITECTSYTHKEIGKNFGVSSGAVGKIASDIGRLMNKDNKLYRDIKSLNSYFEV